MKHITDMGQHDIFRKAALLMALNEKISPHLPANVQGHVKVANYRQGCLVLAIDNAAIATQLRFTTSELLSTLRKDAKLYDLANIKLMVLPPHASPPAQQPEKTMAISEAASHTLSDLAAQLPDDSPLKTAILALSRRKLRE